MMAWVRYLGVLFLLLVSQIDAAAAATHVYFAQLWMEVNNTFDAEDEKRFFAGNLFPDIRYLGTIKRDETHEKNITASKIRKTSCPFKAGMRLHAFVDVKREAFVKKYKTLKKLKMVQSKYRVLFLKLLEDEIFWKQTKTHESQIALATVYSEEIDAGVEYETAREWHDQLIDYFHEEPSKFFSKRSEQAQGFLNIDAKTLGKWSQLIQTLAADPYFQQYCENLAASLKMHFSK